MKRNIMMTGVVVLALVNTISAQVRRSKKSHSMSFASNIIVAHRGAWKTNNLPQNSIASLRQAIALQCTGSEFDVHLTADDSLVINHDDEYAGKVIEKTTYADLIATPLSNGEKLPTLLEYLHAGMQQTHTRLILEIKPSVISKERGIQTAEKVLQLVKQVKAEQWITYISFDYDIVKKVHELAPAVSVQYLNGDKSPKELQKDGITGADYHYSVFQKHPEWITDAHQRGIVLNAWTVNEAAVMDWLIGQQFAFITTNEPELLAQRIAAGR